MKYRIAGGRLRYNYEKDKSIVFRELDDVKRTSFGFEYNRNSVNIGTVTRNMVNVSKIIEQCIYPDNIYIYASCFYEEYKHDEVIKDMKELMESALNAIIEQLTALKADSWEVKEIHL